MGQKQAKSRKQGRRAVPKILPREPLTRKAKAAIAAYVFHYLENCPLVLLLIDKTLKAERMRRADLYSWLESKGYYWKSRTGCWEKSED